MSFFSDLLAEEIREALKGKNTKDAQVAAMVAFIEERDADGPVEYQTGVPGAPCSSEEVGPGVTLLRNGNGTVVAVQFG